MAGIYIHIPFCKKACSYCNFHFSTSLKLKSPLIEALTTEISMRYNYLGTNELQSIYFGGGTPSLLEIPDLDKILHTLSKYFHWNENTEITLEANPDDLNSDILQTYKKLGINRLSIGVQSFLDKDLQFMTRAHNASQAISAILLAQDAGFENITIDLIYGCPGTTDEMWLSNLERVLALNIPHISAYALTVEEKTALQYAVNKKSVIMPEDEKVHHQFELLMDFAEKHQYDHYEISNFAMDNKFAVHNSNYWKSVPYLGLGPSAHSYNGSSRSWNLANNALYIKNIEAGFPICETEVLSRETKYNEYIMTGLRTKWGVSIDKIKKEFGDYFSNYFNKNAAEYLISGHLINNCNNFYLSKEGKFIADKIISDLFFVEDINALR